MKELMRLQVRRWSFEDLFLAAAGLSVLSWVFYMSILHIKSRSDIFTSYLFGAGISLGCAIYLARSLYKKLKPREEVLNDPLTTLIVDDEGVTLPRACLTVDSARTMPNPSDAFMRLSWENILSINRVHPQLNGPNIYVIKTDTVLDSVFIIKSRLGPRAEDFVGLVAIHAKGRQ